MSGDVPSPRASAMSKEPDNFAAIHKVSGASNVCKRPLRRHHFYILRGPSRAPRSHLWLRCPCLHPPTTKCSVDIKATSLSIIITNMVVNLQAQLASLKAQAAQSLGNGSGAALTPQEDKLYQKFPPCQQDGQGFFQTGEGRMPPFLRHTESVNYYNNELLESNCIQSSQMYNPHSGLNDEGVSFGIEDDPSCAMATLDMQPGTWTSTYHEMEDLQSVTFAYLHGS